MVVNARLIHNQNNLFSAEYLKLKLDFGLDEKKIMRSHRKAIVEALIKYQLRGQVVERKDLACGSVDY